MKPIVFVTYKLDKKELGYLGKIAVIKMNPAKRVLSKQELKKSVKGVNAVFSFLADTIDKEVIESAKKLKIIANCAAGYNNIDVKFASQRGIIVTNTPDVLTEATADLTWALILSTVRRIVEGDKYIRTGKFKGWGRELLLGGDFYKRTLGIIGFGRIGEAVAMRALGFNMDVLYASRSRKSAKLEKSLNARFCSLKFLLKHSDIVSLHIPLTKETYHIIGKKELALMKPGAYLINASRGPIVDEKAMANALARKTIAGAGLDVFEQEPKITKKLLSLDNVVMTPHIGSATYYTRRRMLELTCENLVAFLKGKRPPNTVLLK